MGTINILYFLVFSSLIIGIISLVLTIENKKSSSSSGNFIYDNDVNTKLISEHVRFSYGWTISSNSTVNVSYMETDNTNIMAVGGELELTPTTAISNTNHMELNIKVPTLKNLDNIHPVATGKSVLFDSSYGLITSYDVSARYTNDHEYIAIILGADANYSVANVTLPSGNIRIKYYATIVY
jgi:hypothetical protein